MNQSQSSDPVTIAMEPFIDANHLHRSFDGLVAVEDVSLTVAPGEIYGLLGPDGAGKTTTLRLLCGALQPTRIRSGLAYGQVSIRIGGYDVLRQTEQARSQIGYLPQRFSLYEEMTVLENLRFFAEVRGLQATDWRPRCMQILEFVDLADFTDRRAGNLSGGMKQKLGLAAALVHQPRALLLDEPTTGVDPVTRQDFWQLIIQLVANDQGSGVSPAVLISTPYMDEAARCTRVGFLHQGRLVLEGSPAELRSTLDGQILELTGHPMKVLRKSLHSLEHVEDVQMFGDRLHIRVAAGKAAQVISEIGSQPVEQARVTRLRPIEPQLEDVFMTLVAPGERREPGR